MKKPNSPFDTLLYLFLLRHAAWVLGQLGFSGVVSDEKDNQLYDVGGARRFSDAIFDVLLKSGLAGLLHIEVQAK
jgi:hypothetical protein